MKQIMRKIARPVLSLGLSGLFLWLAFRNTDFGLLRDTLSRANYFWALSMFPVLMLSHAARALSLGVFPSPQADSLCVQGRENLLRSAFCGHGSDPLNGHRDLLLPQASRALAAGTAS